MRADSARDAEEAIARLQTAARKGDPFKLALLDFHLLGENGLQLARRITHSPSLRHTRLILLTSSGHANGDEAETGIRYHLTKPLHQSRLLDAIGLAMAPEVHEHSEAVGERETSGVTSRWARSQSRILVAEDQEVNWRLIERMLAKRGHVAVNTRDGQRAIEELEAGDYDLVLIDCQMPVLDGYDATLEIRRREAAAGRGRVPIVAMTANAMLGDSERCLAAGMDDYVPKPITGEALDTALERWLPPARAVALDRTRLDELRSIFLGEEASEVLRKLMVDVTDQIDRVAAALEEGDREAVAEATHRIKNSALMLGASGLAEAASRLDQLANGQHANRECTALEPAADVVFDRWRATQSAVTLELGR
jgi:two-component system sensor histidine kinase/response regulator